MVSPISSSFLRRSSGFLAVPSLHSFCTRPYGPAGIRLPGCFSLASPPWALGRRFFHLTLTSAFFPRTVHFCPHPSLRHPFPSSFPQNSRCGFPFSCRIFSPSSFFFQRPLPSSPRETDLATVTSLSTSFGFEEYFLPVCSPQRLRSTQPSVLVFALPSPSISLMRTAFSLAACHSSPSEAPPLCLTPWLVWSLPHPLPHWPFIFSSPHVSLIADHVPVAAPFS